MWLRSGQWAIGRSPWGRLGFLEQKGKAHEERAVCLLPFLLFPAWNEDLSPGAAGAILWPRLEQHAKHGTAGRQKELASVTTLWAAYSSGLLIITPPFPAYRTSNCMRQSNPYLFQPFKTDILGILKPSHCYQVFYSLYRFRPVLLGSNLVMLTPSSQPMHSVF